MLHNEKKPIVKVGIYPKSASDHFAAQQNKISEGMHIRFVPTNWLAFITCCGGRLMKLGDMPLGCV